jgi:fructose-1-phosphate kinase PfkB-like protein
VTAGNKPTLAFDGQQCWRIIPPAVKTVNPIGSGDAFTACLTWRLLQSDCLGEACRWASAAGAANALTPMAGEIEPKVVKRLLRFVVQEKVH